MPGVAPLAVPSQNGTVSPVPQHPSGAQIALEHVVAFAIAGTLARPDDAELTGMSQLPIIWHSGNTCQSITQFYGRDYPNAWYAYIRDIMALPNSSLCISKLPTSPWHNDHI